MNHTIIKRLATFVLAVLLLVYVGYQFYRANYSPVQTETASFFTTSQSVRVTGTAIRQETVISAAANGVCTYAVPDGGKVSKGGTVARLYADESSAAAQQQIATLNVQIERMDKLVSLGDTYSADQDALSKQISQALSQTLGSLLHGDYTQASALREDLLYLMNQRQIVTRQAQASAFAARRQELTAERDALAKASKATGTVAAPASGYFIAQADGYEAAFTMDDAPGLTVAELKAKQAAPAATEGALGKVCTSFGWYFAALVPGEDVGDFTEGARVTIKFPFASSTAVPAQVEAINQENKQGDAVVLLSSSTMNTELARIRNETAQIQLTEYSGIRVSQKTIRFASMDTQVMGADGKTTTIKQEVQGVYALHGSEVEFRQVFPLFTSGGYVICDPNPDPKDLLTKATVKLYDEVVTEGTELFDGKVVR